MTRSYTCYTYCQNFFSNGKDKLAGAIFTESSHTPTPTAIISHVFISALAPLPTYAKLVAKYINANL